MLYLKAKKFLGILMAFHVSITFFLATLFDCRNSMTTGFTRTRSSGDRYTYINMYIYDVYSGLRSMRHPLMESNSLFWEKNLSSFFFWGESCRISVVYFSWNYPRFSSKSTIEFSVNQSHLPTREYVVARLVRYCWDKVTYGIRNFSLIYDSSPAMIAVASWKAVGARLFASRAGHSPL